MGLSSRTSPSESLLPIRSTAFVVTSGRSARLNVSPLIFRLEEASYLAGMVAAGVSKTGTLGFVGGIQLPPIEAAYQGWLQRR